MFEQDRYTTTAVVLHWVMAALLLALLGLGLYMKDLPLSPDKLRLYSWHKWAGIAALLLLFIRAFWRLGHRPPPHSRGMQPLQRRLVAVVHGLLYLLMFVIPLTGWAMSSAKGFPVVWFGVLPLPDLVDKNKELGDLLAQVHGGLNMLLIGLVVLHVLAALKHHLLDRDQVMARMLPFLKR